MGRHRRTRNEKNIRKDEATDEWFVFKKFKHLTQPHIYKRFKTFREAKKYRDKLIKTDSWISELPPDKRVKVLKSGKNYYTTKNGLTYIYRTKNYIQQFYGNYSTPEDAERVVYHLVLNDWNWDKIPEDVKKLRLSSNREDNKCYYKVQDNKGHIVVRRHIHGENRNYGAYPDKKTADKVISWLSENDWTLDLPDWILELQCEKRTPKYYSKTSDGYYSVNKYLEGKSVNFGSYNTISDVENAVRLLKEHDWDYNWFLENKSELNCNQRSQKYYSKNAAGNYTVVKKLNGNHVNFGTYSTESEAAHAVTLLKEHNWNYAWFLNHKEELNCNPRYTSGRVKI